MPIKHRYHPYEENQKKGYKTFMDGKKKKPQSSNREARLASLGDFESPEFYKKEMSKNFDHFVEEPKSAM